MPSNPMPKWMREHRNWVVYGLSPDKPRWIPRDDMRWEQKPGGRVYVGMTSRPLAARMAEHVRDAAAGKTCPVNAAMRRDGGGANWYIYPLEHISSAKYKIAKTHEKRARRRLEELAGTTVLNRHTLRCA